MTDANESDIPVFDQPSPPKTESDCAASNSSETLAPPPQNNSPEAMSPPPQRSSLGTMSPPPQRKSLEAMSPPPPDSSRSVRKLSKAVKTRDTTTTTGAESPRSSSSMKSPHRSDSSRKLSSHIPSHGHRSDSLPTTKKASNKKSLSLPMKQEAMHTELPPFSSARSSISATGTSASDSPKGMKYTSIDLENELPEIFSSSLNPAIQDPDMSEFYSRGPPFYKAKSPPPLYISRKASTISSVPSVPSRKTTRSAYVEKRARMKIWLTLFIAVFFIFPISVVIVFRLIPSLMNYLDGGSQA